MSLLVSLIQARLAELNLSPQAASLRAGLGKDGVRNILRGVSKSPRAHNLRALEKVLGIELVEAVEKEISTPLPIQPYRRRHAAMPPARANRLAQEPSPPRDLPILGQAKGGLGNALFLDQGRPLGYVDRPAYLVGVPDAFAVIVRGDSMEPRYCEGELVFVHPHKPPRPGAYVVVETIADEAFLKRLVRITEKMVVTRALNPPPGDQMEFSVKAVRRLHRVVGMTEDWV